jgi:hypothetical protein
MKHGPSMILAERLRPSTSAAAMSRIMPGLAARIEPIGTHWTPEGSNAIAVNELAHDNAALALWLAAEAEGSPGIDRKAQAAFLIGKAAHAVCLPLAGLLLAHRLVPRLTPEAVGLAPERYTWEHDGRSGEAIRYRLHFDTDAIEAAEGDAEALHAVLHDALRDTLAPLVAALRAASGLAPAALWRLVADMVCAAFLTVGQALGDLPGAQTAALAITRRAGASLNNGRSGFQHVALPDPADPSRIVAESWFITRGGCCRWYTCAEGEYCSTCVLLKPEQQQARLRAYLRTTLETPAA